MKITVIVQNPELDQAYHFVEAALSADHEVPLVFFYQQGVFAADTAAGNPNSERWRDLASRMDLQLGICIGASERRGLVTAVGEPEEGKQLDDTFEVMGLGQLAGAMLESDRVVTFS